MNQTFEWHQKRHHLLTVFYYHIGLLNTNRLKSVAAKRISHLDVALVAMLDSVAAALLMAASMPSLLPLSYSWAGADRQRALPVSAHLLRPSEQDYTRPATPAYAQRAV